MLCLEMPDEEHESDKQKDSHQIEQKTTQILDDPIAFITHLLEVRIIALILGVNEVEEFFLDFFRGNHIKVRYVIDK
jgi:hypothetical protein